MTLDNKAVVALLRKAKVDARVFDQDLYMCDKIAQLAKELTREFPSAASLQEVTAVSLLTLLNFAKAQQAQRDVTLKYEHFAHAIMRTKLSDNSESDLVALKVSAIAEVSQVRRSIKTLRDLNMMRETTKDCFAINSESATLVAALEKFAS